MTTETAHKSLLARLGSVGGVLVLQVWVWLWEREERKRMEKWKWPRLSCGLTGDRGGPLLPVGTGIL